MIKTQIITEGDRPVAVVLDYEEYQRLKKIQEDYQDYHDALDAERSTSTWHDHESVKKELGI